VQRATSTTSPARAARLRRGDRRRPRSRGRRRRVRRPRGSPP
jgi:hypothetical protein